MPQVKIYRTAHPSSPWQVSAYLPGQKRLRRHFRSSAEAQDFAGQLRQQIAYEGAEGFRFTAEYRAEFVAAMRRLGEVGASLSDAVEFYLAHHSSGPAINYLEAVEALLEAKRAANRRPRTIQGLRVQLRAFNWHGNVQTVADVTPGAVTAFLSRRGLGPRARLAYRTALVTFCKFCRRRGWMKGDPLAAIERPALDPVNVKVLTPAQCARLMTAAAQVAGGRCVRAVALRLLAGLRPAEVDALDEADIKANSIRVAVGKIRGRRALRVVPVSPVLRAWLELWPQAPLRPHNWTQLWRKIRRQARVPVQQDGLRKTWISYRLAEVKDERQVAREAGNSPDIIYRHYYDLIEAADVPRFGAFSAWPAVRGGVDGRG